MALSGLRHPRSQAWLSHPLGKAGSDPETPKAAGISPLTPAKLGSDPPVQEHCCPCGKTVFLEFPHVEQFQSSRFLIFPSPPRFNFFSLFFLSPLAAAALEKSEEKPDQDVFLARGCPRPYPEELGCSLLSSIPYFMWNCCLELQVHQENRCGAAQRGF